MKCPHCGGRSFDVWQSSPVRVNTETGETSRSPCEDSVEIGCSDCAAMLDSDIDGWEEARQSAENHD